MKSASERGALEASAICHHPVESGAVLAGGDDPCDVRTTAKARPAHYWSEHEDDILRRMADSGASGSAIARELRRTRSAVLGRAHRVGLRLKGGISGTPAEKPAPKLASTVSVKSNRKRGRVQGGIPGKSLIQARKQAVTPDIPKVEFVEPTIPDAETAPRMVPLVDLGLKDCHFPIGDPRKEGFGFCGHEVREGSRYCPFHHVIAYRPAKEAA